MPLEPSADSQQRKTPEQSGGPDWNLQNDTVSRSVVESIECCWQFMDLLEFCIKYHQMVNELFGSCHVVAWDLDAPTFPNSFMDAACGPKAPLYRPISKFLRWTDPLPPEERISVSANKHFVGKSICFILHTSAYFCCIVTKSNKKRTSTRCRLWISIQCTSTWICAKTGLSFEGVWRAGLCCDQCSHKFLSVPSVAMKCIRDQAAMATAKMKTRIVNRFACRSFLADASDGSVFKKPMWHSVFGANHQDPKVFGTRKVRFSGINFFPSFFHLFSLFQWILYDSMYRCILYDLMVDISQFAQMPREFQRRSLELQTGLQIESHQIGYPEFDSGYVRKYMEIYGNIWIKNDQKVAKEFYNPIFGPKWLGNLEWQDVLAESHGFDADSQGLLSWLNLTQRNFGWSTHIWVCHTLPPRIHG